MVFSLVNLLYTFVQLDVDCTLDSVDIRNPDSYLIFIIIYKQDLI